MSTAASDLPTTVIERGADTESAYGTPTESTGPQDAPHPCEPDDYCPICGQCVVCAPCDCEEDA